MHIEVIKLTDDPGVTLTCYITEKSPEMSAPEKLPAVLVIPGGGYRFCSDREGEPIALSYAARGFQAFVLRYSVGDAAAFPRPLDEAQSAMQTILDRAEEWRIDTGRIAAIGFSAGGHLAAALGVMGKPRPSALILGYPCILESISRILAVPVPGLDTLVSGDAPPAFMFATAEDKTVPVENTLAFAQSYANAGIPFEVHVFQKGPHGLSLATEQVANGRSDMADPVFAQWLDMSIAWLKRQWEGK